MAAKRKKKKKQSKRDQDKRTRHRSRRRTSDTSGGPGQTGSQSGPPSASPRTRDHQYVLGHHVVCLIDVLGQKNRLAGLAKLPPLGELTEEFINAFKGTIGLLEKFKEQFLTYFAQMGQGSASEAFKALPPVKQEAYRRIQDCRRGVQRFSDTFVFHSPILNEHGDILANPLFEVLGACCMAMILSLADVFAVRGGLTIGVGAELEDGSFYGPALAEAHHLEKEVAGYPRVVVSGAVHEFLDEVRVFSKAADVNSGMAEISRTCRLFLCEDVDGLSIVDFLGEGMRTVCSSDARLSGPIRMAYDFVSAEAERFGSDGNQKLADRYDLLLAYMVSRLGLWGIDAQT